MAGGIDLAEVQEPSPNATVSWVGILVGGSVASSVDYLTLSGCGASLAFLPAWPHLGLHVLRQFGGYACEADGSRQHGCVPRHELH